MQDHARKIIDTTSKSLGLAEIRSHRVADGVQLTWRRHGWLPPTEMGKDFRASLKNTADRQAVTY